MPQVQVVDLADLAAATLDHYRRGSWTDISYPEQEYIAFSRLIRENNIGLGSGKAITWDVQVEDSGGARNVGIGDVDNVNIPTTLVQATARWNHYNSPWGIDEREVSMNEGEAQIISLVKERMHTARISLARLMEADFWSKPADSTDTLKPFGVPYWIVYNSSTGFNGGDPSGFTAGAGGIDSDTYSRWKNYTAQYTTVSLTDLVRKWRRAATFTMFMSPDPHPDLNTGDTYGYFTVYSVLGSLEEIAESRNDRLGSDIAFMDGKVMFRGIRVTWAPYLENKAGAPVYGVNWGVFKPFFLNGWMFRTKRVDPAPNQHTMLNVHEDVTLNYVCYDRRRNFVIATADPA